MLKKFLILIGIFITMYLVMFFWPAKQNKNIIIGTSFDPTYAVHLGLNSKQVFDRILTEWNFKYLRLSAHWDEIEPEQDKFDFTGLDYYLNKVNKHDAKVVLAVGQKTPRWPECHAPEWATSLSDEEYFNALDKYIETVIKKYQDHPALEMWQIENEPFFGFGEECRKMTKEQLSVEVGLARESGLPVMVTDSGELSTWRLTANSGDWFGTTLYRVVWNKYLGYWNYDWLPASFYKLKLRFWGRGLENSMVAELQSEPWLPGNSIEDVALEEQYKSMNLERLKKHLEYSAKIGVPRTYLWGAEWWVWLETKGNGEIIEYIEGLDKNSPVFFPQLD